MPGLVYTANVGGYDKPRPLGFREQGVDYVCLTDGPPVEGWTTIPVGNYEDARAAARMIKITVPLIHPSYDWWLWVDGNIKIVGPVRELAERLLSKHEFAAMQHPWWDCSYKEIDKCIELKKDTPENLEAARAYLREEGMPKQAGQIATWLLFRKHSELVEEHAKQWWADCSVFTMRDQVTFMLNLRRVGAEVNMFTKGPKANEWRYGPFHFVRGHR